MVAAAQQQQPTSKASAEEEALKRNTDCVYFLASPLTCKKGSECEYRHSEYARVNPRDCYYWLNGSCLNPKCGFRHPPLEGLLGTQATASTATSMPSLQVAATPATHAPNSSKQVPCIFFQKGLCLKGERCAFLHGPMPTATKVPPLGTAPTQCNEPAPLKKLFGVSKTTQEQKAAPLHVPKEVVAPALYNKPTPNIKTSLSRNNLVSEREALRLPEEEIGHYRAKNVSPPVIGGRSNRLHQAHALDEQSFHNGKDGDELLRESSPGFDVLVEDELGESDYYHGEDQYGRSRGGHHEGNEYDMGRPVDYNSMADIEREAFRDPRSYDSYRHRASTERLDRRNYSKTEDPDQVGESDLRYRLSKKNRRANGLRSVVNPDYASERHMEDRSHRGRESHHQSSLGSSRLRGRIKLPSRSPVNGGDMRPEREMDRRGNWGMVTSGRVHDRIKGRIEDGSDMRSHRVRGETMDFAGPKSLAELKGGRREEQQILGKRKSLLDDHNRRHQQHSLDDVSFEGPMPLSEILKRKRGAAPEKSEKESKEDSSNNTNNNNIAVVSNDLTNNHTNKEEENSKCKNEDQDQDQNKDQDHEEGMIGDDQEVEGEYPYEYEQVEEGEDYIYEEGENAEEYVEEEEEGEGDEDTDDFAKKMGVMFS